jgi:hypothetical protein
MTALNSSRMSDLFIDTCGILIVADISRFFKQRFHLKTKSPFCLHVLEMCDDDNVPLFTEETFRRNKANLAATATVKAATGMSVGRRR